MPKYKLYCRATVVTEIEMSDATFKKISDFEIGMGDIDFDFKSCDFEVLRNSVGVFDIENCTTHEKLTDD